MLIDTKCVLMWLQKNVNNEMKIKCGEQSYTQSGDHYHTHNLIFHFYGIKMYLC